MLISPISMNAVSTFVDRLKQQGGDSGHGDGFGLKKVGSPLGSRFAELLNDPMVQMGNTDAVQNFLGLGTGKDSGDMSALEGAMFGSMNLTNVKALATLTKVLGDDQNPFASMFRTLSAPEGNALRMPVSPPPGSTAMQGASPIAEMEAAMRSVMETEGGQASAMDTATSLAQVRTPAAHGQPIRSATAEAVTNPAQLQAVQEPQATQPAQAADPAHRLGALAAQFESGSRGGITAIGYDRRGGTSYGKYQMSSRAGTMDAFLKYLDNHAPDMAAQLKKAGRANTGSRFGAMPTAWKQLADAQPGRFEALQDRFIHSNNFSPAFRAISKAMHVDEMNPALKEVLFSTAVQHGPTGAVRIFAKAFGRTGGFEEGQEADFIRNVYRIRQGQFASSSHGVQNAVQGRLGDELRMALSMLEQSDLV